MSQRDRYAYPFQLVLPRERIEDALADAGVVYRRRVFDPATTLLTWLSQIVSQDRSCRDAVSRVVAFNAARGRRVSASTGAYVQARQRLDMPIIRALARSLARGLEDDWHAQAPLGRPLIAVDGSGLSTPDTPSIQRRYPQVPQMAQGIGFPVLRVVPLFSLTTGAFLDIGAAAQEGEKTGELSIFRRMWPRLRKGDIVVGDRAYHSYWHLLELSKRRIGAVFRMRDVLLPARHQVIETLSPGDRIVSLQRPGVTPEVWQRFCHGPIPRRLNVRLITYDIGGSRKLSLSTTLKDPELVEKATLAEIYKRRWDAEVDLRSFKIDLGADILSCKTAAMVDKELWATVLAYNAVRAIMARAAAREGVQPRSLSFKTALQAIGAFSPRMDHADASELPALEDRMLTAIASHKVGNRPDRAEPRLVKRRRKKADKLTIPRDEARARLTNGRYRG